MDKQLFDINHAKFSVPVKQIFDSQTAANFQQSIAIRRIRYYISKYIKLITGRPVQRGSGASSLITESILRLLRTLFVEIENTPPLKGPRRYGNMACRTWHDKINALLPGLIEKMLNDFLPTKYIKAHLVDELVYYIENCFGSKIRLDFGTGHELSFIAFIACLDMLNLISDMDANDFLLILSSYYHIAKKLILTYNLEPAGSHGVWGLDDHFHLIYIWGSAQFNSPEFSDILPRDLVAKKAYINYKDTNFFCLAIDFILTVKKGPFSEHSPIIYDILHNVRNWSKIEKGLLKMYDDEVLNKFPVVQHFWFGDGFFPWVHLSSGKSLPLYEPVNDQTDTDDRVSTDIFGSKDTSFPQESILRRNSPSVLHEMPASTSRMVSNKYSNLKSPNGMGPPSSRIVNKLLRNEDPRQIDRFRK